ncbi:hypothetical protein CS542_06595 [Pedobacter sp. IW39]|nr:hypothetical protein CS542_06595 [Pedobacter sp. IW39]
MHGCCRPFMTMFASGYNRKYLMALTRLYSCLLGYIIISILAACSSGFYLAFLHPVLVSTRCGGNHPCRSKDAHQMMAIVIGGSELRRLLRCHLQLILPDFNNWQSSLWYRL